MDYPSVIFWLLTAYSLWSRGPAVYYLFFGAQAFGSLSVIPPALLGGISLTPAWLASCLVIFKVFMEMGPERYLQALIDPRRFLALGLCTLYSVASCFFLPRMFAGQFNVFVMQLSLTNSYSPVGPSSANFTQIFYFLLTVAATISFYFAASDPKNRPTLLAAFRFGAIVTILCGVADFVAAGTGMASLLKPFRNANYAIMDDIQVMNVKRVIGLSTEASAYAGICMNFLALLLLLPVYPRKYSGGPLAKWLICFGLLGGAYMSASSGGFVGLAVLALTGLVAILIDGLKLKAGALLGIYLLGLMGCVVLAVWVWMPGVFDRPVAVINALVFQKTSSASYAERSSWNAAAYNAFIKTFGLGAGMGSVRASSWIYSILGNIGLPGALTLALFLIQVLLASTRGREPGDAALSRAVKFALIPNLVIASLSGTAVNYGLGPAWLIGLTTAITWPIAPAIRQRVKAPNKRSLADVARPVSGAVSSDMPHQSTS